MKLLFNYIDRDGSTEVFDPINYKLSFKKPVSVITGSGVLNVDGLKELNNSFATFLASYNKMVGKASEDELRRNLPRRDLIDTVLDTISMALGVDVSTPHELQKVIQNKITNSETAALSANADLSSGIEPFTFMKPSTEPAQMSNEIGDPEVQSIVDASHRRSERFAALNSSREALSSGRVGDLERKRPAGFNRSVDDDFDTIVDDLKGETR